MHQGNTIYNDDKKNSLKKQIIVKFHINFYLILWSTPHTKLVNPAKPCVDFPIIKHYKTIRSQKKRTLAGDFFDPPTKHFSKKIQIYKMLYFYLVFNCSISLFIVQQAHS